MNEAKLRELIKETVARTLEHRSAEQVDSTSPQLKPGQVPIAVSNRHIHLSETAVERLFGKGYRLTKKKDLSQPGQFAAEETVTIIGPKGRIERVRVLGPARGNTQVEVSLYDGFTLGVTPPVRNSGDIEGTPGVKIQGPRGQLTIDKGLICAARHIHMHPDDAERFGVKDQDFVSVHAPSERPVTFDHTLIRVSEKYRLEMHVDLDEANAAGMKSGTVGNLIKGK
ncbi:phosphate propanoyltransferase [Alteribacter natronophilus]|uniref:phosphate propanoyltransferase n=1 Tax=Alteribacter natronophilus TaxID=2583810 RepID=UPI00110D4388|nr:phosphate propanoyltransferase [Alteribacter natronophilus]TMW71033.1 phosphate propanoyltransferase [Alteribacter natronophilus]